MSDFAVSEKTPVAEPSLDEIQQLFTQLQLSPSSNLIGALQQTQEHFGYLPRAALRELSHCLRLPLARIYGVVSFYAQFYLEPHGKHTILCCRGTACHVKGAGRVIDALEQHLGVKEGETTPDMMFYLETAACLGACFLAPVMMIDNQYYGMLTPQKVAKILQTHHEEG